MCLLPAPGEVGSLGASVFTKADSSHQHPKNFCLLISHESVFARVICGYWTLPTRESRKNHSLLSVCLGMGEILVIWNPRFSPPSCLTAVCGQVCSAAHVSRKTGLQAFRASVFKSSGERRQQSSAGWCLPKCGLRTGRSDGSWHETWFPLGVHPA